MGYTNAETYIRELYQNRILINYLYTYRDLNDISIERILESIPDLGREADLEEMMYDLSNKGIVTVIDNNQVMLDTDIIEHLEKKLGALRRPGTSYTETLDELEEEIGYFTDASNREKRSKFPKIVTLIQRVPNQIEAHLERLSTARRYIATVENPKEKFNRLGAFNKYLENVLRFLSALNDFLDTGLSPLLHFQHEHASRLIQAQTSAKRSIRNAQRSILVINEEVIKYIHKFIKDAAFYRKINNLYAYVRNGTLEKETNILEVAENWESITPEFRIFRNIDPANVSGNPIVEDILKRATDKLHYHGETDENYVDEPADNGIPKKVESYRINTKEIWESFHETAKRKPETSLCDFIFNAKFESPITDTEAIAAASAIVEAHIDELTVQPWKGIRNARSRRDGTEFQYEYPILTLRTI